jgi:hypothetical protein
MLSMVGTAITSLDWRRSSRRSLYKKVSPA